MPRGMDTARRAVAERIAHPMTARAKTVRSRSDAQRGQSLRVQHLVRSSPHHLEIIGLRCGIQRPWEKEPCGGKLRVEDFHPKGVRGWTRYEIYCDKCHTCDPNGWARQDEILPAAQEHFHALLDTANAGGER